MTSTNAKGLSGDILIVDDNAENLRLLSSLLSNQGHRVRAANSGQLAIQSAARLVPDLVLLDIKMPQLDGYQTCQQLKAQPGCHSLPIIFISALSSEEDKVHAFEAGGVDYLTKPFQEAEVLARVATHLKLAKLQLDLERMVETRTAQLQEAYEAVSRKEAKYRGLFNDALDMIHLVNLDGLITDVNPVELSTLGYKEHELLGSPLLTIIHPDQQPRTRAMMEQVFSGVQVRGFETVLRGKSNNQVDVEMSVVPLVEQGQVQGARAILHDISERKRTEKYLHDSNRLHSEAQEMAGFGHWQLDINQGGLNCSSGLLRIFELESKKAGSSLEDLMATVHPADRDMVRQAYKESLQQQKSYTLQHRLLMEDGRVKHIHEKCRTDFDSQGQPLRSIGTVQDITLHKNMENQLRQAQKMEAIGTLAGGIAHDFNNILTPILGYSEMIKEQAEPQSSMAREAGEVIRAANRAKELVQQILTFSRQSEQTHKPLKPHLVVKEALRLLRSTIPSSIELLSAIDSNSGMIMANPTQIHQLVMNLCTNAFHALANQEGQIKVKLESISLDEQKADQLRLDRGDYLQITVEDTGCGMSKEVQAKIFDPYFTTKKQGEGTGLGLAVVMGNVQNLGGAIELRSVEGAGSTFMIYLPTIPVPTEDETDSPALPLPGGSETVLVVDDEQAITKMISTFLRRLGYQVHDFTDCKEALDFYRQSPAIADLVITDMTMPHITGQELARKMWQLRPELPVILCTGFSRLISAEQARELGMSGFLMKPIRQNTLATAVRHALDHPRATC